MKTRKAKRVNLKKFLISKEYEDRHSTNRHILWKLCLSPFIDTHYYGEVSANEKVFDGPISGETNYSYEEKIIDEIAYVTAWQLSPTAKKKIDINENSYLQNPIYRKENTMFRKRIIDENQRGFLFNNGKYQKMLAPGKERYKKPRQRIKK